MHWRTRPDGTRYVSLPMAAPLMPDGPQGRAVGAVVFELSPEQHFYPVLEHWPTPSPSAEIVVFVRERVAPSKSGQTVT